MTSIPQTSIQLSIHNNIKRKLTGFYNCQRIPHLLFHGSPGTGKRTLVYDFVNKIYGGDKHKLKTNVMFVNCAHGKGIKFIRDELKFFAKTNIQGNQGVSFKTIVLFNADSLTIDAQSALRRCIELFSYNTRFFIVVENKHKLLNPILSRFCEIYVPEYMNADGKVQNLHQVQLLAKYGPQLDKDERLDWFASKLSRAQSYHYSDFVEIATEAYELGYSCLDLMDYIKSERSNMTEIQKSDLIMRFQKVKGEYRCEKLLMLGLLGNLRFP